MSSSAGCLAMTREEAAEEILRGPCVVCPDCKGSRMTPTNAPNTWSSSRLCNRCSALGTLIRLEYVAAAKLLGLREPLLMGLLNMQKGL